MLKGTWAIYRSGHDENLASRFTIDAIASRRSGTPWELHQCFELLKMQTHTVTTDWTLRENVRAKLRVPVNLILRKHGYPRGRQEKATQTVLEHAPLMLSIGPLPDLVLPDFGPA